MAHALINLPLRVFHCYLQEYQEELNLPEIMLPNINPLLTVPPSLHPLYPGASKDADKLEPQKFVTTHFAGVTCKDQYRKMKDFDQNVLKKLVKLCCTVAELIY